MVQHLDAARILAVWETGIAQCPLDRAVAMLWYAGAEGDIADWPLTERDRQLLELRRVTFGARITALADCPECCADHDLQLDVGELAQAINTPEPEVVTDAGQAVTLRALTSRDLAALAEVPDTDLARLARARLTDSDAPSFPDELTRDIDARIEARASDAEIGVRMTCAECGAIWTEVLDVAAYLWTEVEAAAHRIMAEIAEIAGAFSWSESDILAMSEPRRQAYLALARGQ